jgi:ABC-type phosphate/phosphonate transport system ATPase subunit
MAFLEANGIRKSYLVGAAPLMVLRDLSLAVEAGEMVAIMGASGVGKSTLLHVLDAAADDPLAAYAAVRAECLAASSTFCLSLEIEIRWACRAALCNKITLPATSNKLTENITIKSVGHVQLSQKRLREIKRMKRTRKG